MSSNTSSCERAAREPFREVRDHQKRGRTVLEGRHSPALECIFKPAASGEHEKGILIGSLPAWPHYRARPTAVRDASIAIEVAGADPAENQKPIICQPTRAVEAAYQSVSKVPRSRRQGARIAANRSGHQPASPPSRAPANPTAVEAKLPAGKGTAAVEIVVVPGI
jgi:hypothetical protein